MIYSQPIQLAVLFIHWIWFGRARRICARSHSPALRRLSSPHSFCYATWITAALRHEHDWQQCCDCSVYSLWIFPHSVAAAAAAAPAITLPFSCRISYLPFDFSMGSRCLHLFLFNLSLSRPLSLPLFISFSPCLAASRCRPPPPPSSSLCNGHDMKMCEWIIEQVANHLYCDNRQR